MKTSFAVRYELGRKLGETPHKVTFLAKDRLVDTDPVVLKIYRGIVSKNERRTLEDEVAWYRALKHPHVATITDAGTVKECDLFVVRPHSENALALPASTTQLEQLIEAVRFLHSHDRIHGRIKPSNLLIRHGYLQLADASSVTPHIQTAEDVQFTSPEMFYSPRRPSRETDYYSVGAILYRTYAGRNPFADPLVENLKTKYLHGRIPPLAEVAGVSQSLSDIVHSLLHRDNAKRAAAFQALLERVALPPSPAVQAPFVGRITIINSLRQRFSNNDMGRSLSVTIVDGEIGIGKTRLVEELTFRCRFTNIDVFSVACVNTNTPLAPLVTLLRAIVQKRSLAKKTTAQETLGPFCVTLSSLLGFDGEILEIAMERLIQDIIAALSLLSRAEPLNIIIEDLEKADEATIAFLSHLCYRASELRVRLLLTCRSTFESHILRVFETSLGSSFEQMTLGPLEPLEIATLVTYVDPAALTKRPINIGNPLHVLNSASQGSPHSQGDLVRMVREELQPPVLRVAQALAVCGLASTAEMLSAVLSDDLECVIQHLRWLGRCGLVSENEARFLCRTEDLRRAVESSIHPVRKRQLHRRWYDILRGIDTGTVDEETLAKHAYDARLWIAAAIHYDRVATSAMHAGDASHALSCYRRLNCLSNKLETPLNPKQRAALAECLYRAGKTHAAERIYHSLLKSEEMPLDDSLRLDVLSKFANLCRRSDKRLATLREAIVTSISDRALAPVLYSRLSTAFAIAGDLESAAEALSKADLYSIDRRGEAATYITAASGFLQFMKGNYREALKTFGGVPGCSLNMTAAILSNSAVCFEHLGNLRKACFLQRQALQLAKRSGHFIGQVTCLANIGVFQVKLGDVREARRTFAAAWQFAQESDPQGRASNAIRRIQAEEAALHIMEGRYSAALQQLGTVLASGTLYELERFLILLLTCETRLLQGEVAVLKRLVATRLAHSQLSASPLISTRMLLLRSREQQTSEGRETLLSAVSEAAQAGLVYEGCRMEIEYSIRSVEANDLPEVKLHAEEAFRIAKKNGYRPLLAEAMMLRGLGGTHEREREHWLMQGFKLASEIGMPELIAESAYHIGELLLKQGNVATGRDYLLKSTAITSELAEQIPTRHRSRYLAKPWRRSARRRLEECVQQQTAALPAIPTLTFVPQRESQFFSTLYRIGIIGSAAATVDAFMTEFLETVDAALRRPVVLALTRDDHTIWRSSRLELNDDIKKQVMAAASRAKDKPLFDYRDRNRTRGAIAWIPLHSAQFSGGIYVARREHEMMAEREIEFLSILGSVASNALDQIDARLRSAPPVMHRNEFHGIVGTSRAIREVCRQVEIAAGNVATVLIEGETGAGKEVIARAIHKLSGRAQAPFIAVDCGAIPDGLIESELFGSKRGSYTGATTDRPGLFEAANRGTLFLDEISNTNLNVQAKLLRVLQEREVRRVGETRGRIVDVRLIAATNRNLNELVQQGGFRQDLLYRLNVLHLTVPPLRSRREDIPVLAAHFLNRLNATQKSNKIFAPTAFETVAAHSFPGNVRELQNAVERSFFTSKGTTIQTVRVDHANAEGSIDDVKSWFKDLSEGRKDFWTAIHERYKRRDIPREKIVALVDLGLRATQGSYTDLALLFRVGDRGYRRLMDFLRRNECLLDFRPYRKAAPGAAS